MPVESGMPSALQTDWDLIVIGGGITGAGILREAARTGCRVLLLEAGDYASGTSSWSSKLVHGGLRYLRTGQWRLTLESVRERKRLLAEAAGLINPLPFLLPRYPGSRPARWQMRLGLWLYDRMAGERRSGSLSAEQALATTPSLRREELLGALCYEDASTDDARLVLRLILDAQELGAQARNYTPAALWREQDRVCGVELPGAGWQPPQRLRARVVVNATGVWARRLDPRGPRLRPLRGSHLLFPAARLPLQHAVSWPHPRDQRPVFAYPWEGAVLYGTTDLDHSGELDHPHISAAESLYLMEGLQFQFPRLWLSTRDILASFSGIRPVVAGGRGDPSAESRESALWSEPGLVGVTGGKLTTFRVTARQVLARAAEQHPPLQPRPDAALFDGATHVASQQRLYGRLGVTAAGRLLQETPGEERTLIDTSPYTWAELRWAARHEQVRHLDDLLLRRTRLGLVLPDGAAAVLPRLRAICQEELGWDDARWQQEQDRYQRHWQQQHRPPA
jgi:glycerol-3-phosphate dehydrogenase